MTGPVVILTSKARRDMAVDYVMRAPAGSVVEFKPPRRTLPQNDRLHAMITIISRELLWHGQRLSVDDWKLVFMDGLNREVRAVPSLDGRGFVNLGRKTSRLSVADFNDLMALIEAFAAEHEVDLGEKVE